MLFRPESKYPKQLRVKKRAYKIRFVNLIQRNPSILGLCTESPPCIKIKRRKSKRKMAITYLHEVLHAIEFEYDLKIKHRTIYELSEALIVLLEKNI